MEFLSSPITITILVLVVVLVATIFAILKRYKKCKSDEILVVWGKTKKNVSSLVYPGGAKFVLPVIQGCSTMSTRTFQIISDITGIDAGQVKTNAKVALTTGISNDTNIMKNAINRFLTTPLSEIKEQIKVIFDGAVRDVMAKMPIETLNSDREAFKQQCIESLEVKLKEIGFAIIDINIQRIWDEDEYLDNMGKNKVEQGNAQAKANIAEQKKKGEVREAEIAQEKAIKVAEAEQKRETQVTQTRKEQAVKIAEITKEREIETATAVNQQESGKAEQQAIQRANVARSQADAEIKEAEAAADSQVKVAQAEAGADAAQAEAEAEREVRIARAEQKQEAETIKATQEKEAQQAEYESNKAQRKAEADKKAGVAQQKAKIEVANARAEAGKAEADADKVTETAKVEAALAVERTRQQRQQEVNEAEAKATEAKLRASEIVPAEKEKEKTIIVASAAKEKKVIEAEGDAEATIKKAKAEAEAIRIKKQAEAYGIEMTKLADAKGEEAHQLALARGIQETKKADAAAFVEMVNAAGGNVDKVVQFSAIEQYRFAFDAQGRIAEGLKDANLTIYGSEMTVPNLVGGLVKQLAPSLDILNGGLKGGVKELFGFGQKDEQLPKKSASSEESPDPEE